MFAAFSICQFFGPPSPLFISHFFPPSPPLISLLLSPRQQKFRQIWKWGNGRKEEKWSASCFFFFVFYKHAFFLRTSCIDIYLCVLRSSNLSKKNFTFRRSEGGRNLHYQSLVGIHFENCQNQLGQTWKALSKVVFEQTVDIKDFFFSKSKRLIKKSESKVYTVLQVQFRASE